VSPFSDSVLINTSSRSLQSSDLTASVTAIVTATEIGGTNLSASATVTIAVESAVPKPPVCSHAPHFLSAFPHSWCRVEILLAICAWDMQIDENQVLLGTYVGAIAASSGYADIASYTLTSTRLVDGDQMFIVDSMTGQVHVCTDRFNVSAHANHLIITRARLP